MDRTVGDISDCKSFGNECYENGNYELAISYYSWGILLNMYQSASHLEIAILMNNRAQCNIKLNKHHKALRDLNWIIDIYIQNRASAIIAMGEVSPAQFLLSTRCHKNLHKSIDAQSKYILNHGQFESRIRGLFCFGIKTVQFGEQ